MFMISMHHDCASVLELKLLKLEASKREYIMATHPKSTESSRFLLLGDCFAAAVGQAAKAADFPFVGGPLAPALEFYREFIRSSQDDIEFCDSVTLKYSSHQSSPNALYRGFLSELGITRIGELRIPLVTTFGFSTYLHAEQDNWRIYRTPDGGFPDGFLDSILFKDIILTLSRGAIDFYRHVLEMGIRVIAVMPPQRILDSSDLSVFMRAQVLIAEKIRSLNGEIVDIRYRTTDDRGLQRPELCEPKSPIHGNRAFGRLILADLVDRGV